MSNWDGGIRVNAFVSGGFLPRKMQGTTYTGEKTARFVRFLFKNASFCQDRLGTSIGKTQSSAVFSQALLRDGTGAYDCQPTMSVSCLISSWRRSFTD
eukprot:COSAG06_NODE_4619_length_4093_cov_55.188216_1_plen_98_part_00